MDIKNALNSILPLNLRAKTAVDRTIKSGNATDRDGNGQMPFDQNQQQKEPMTEQELEKALQHLKDLPAVKDHNLTVELTEQNGKRFVLLKEPDGKIIRRIPELELWSLPVMTESEPNKKGQLLRKTA
ncbi:MAG: hypothetical protein ACAH59_12730 [Pseudobdellovibrionaceae bacterium]